MGKSKTIPSTQIKLKGANKHYQRKKLYIHSHNYKKFLSAQTNFIHIKLSFKTQLIVKPKPNLAYDVLSALQKIEEVLKDQESHLFRQSVNVGKKTLHKTTFNKAKFKKTRRKTGFQIPGNQKLLNILSVTSQYIPANFPLIYNNR